MSKAKIALRLADELGVSVAKARRFIDDVGVSKARTALDDVAEAGGRASRTVGNYWKPAAIGTVGGGAVFAGYQFREQDVERMKRIAEQEQSVTDGLTSILNADLAPDARRKLLEMYLQHRNKGAPTAPGDGIFGGGATQMVVVVVVVAVVLNYALSGGGRW